MEQFGMPAAVGNVERRVQPRAGLGDLAAPGECPGDPGRQVIGGVGETRFEAGRNGEAPVDGGGLAPYVVGERCDRPRRG
jgi:hypothetical protein